MFLSLNWLKDYIDFPKNITPDELGGRLTMHTVEIDGVQRQGDKFRNIIVGKILEVSPHPNAERLRLARVDIGKEELSIVCGAPNIEAGQLAPVALLGAVLASGMEIKEAEIRGVKSCGMLCAADEIGLGEDHSGIMILDAKAKPGQPLSQYLDIDDVIFEVDNKSITNRPDLWGHIGMARDICAFLDLKPSRKMRDILDARAADLKSGPVELGIEVKVEDQELCPRYMALAMDNIKVAQSPRWLRDRLVAVGVRPINNIVDATNYVMLELGQPLHAFDYSLISSAGGANGRITVRRAKDGEEITTLDGAVRRLDKETLLITDSVRPLAVAGVMGGADSGINPATERIVIESANFNFVSIRKTSARLGLRTEASMRYEKSLDPHLCECALVRAAELIKEICPGARIAGQAADAAKMPPAPALIAVTWDWLDRFMGIRADRRQVAGILSRLGFGIEEIDGGLSVSVPSWRATKDISAKEDIAEEVARIIGYDNIAPDMPLVSMSAPDPGKRRLFEREIRRIMSNGAFEASNYSFVGEEQLRKLGIDTQSHIRLMNPIAANLNLLRQNLSPNLILACAANQMRQDSFAFFEIGGIFVNVLSGPDKGGASGGNLPYQEKRLGIAVCAPSSADAYDRAKALLQNLLEHFRLSCEYAPFSEGPNWALDGYSAAISSGKAEIGTLCAVAQGARSKNGLKKNLAIAEISLDKLFAIFENQPPALFTEFERYPRLIRDLAFVVDEKILYSDIHNEIRNFHPLICEAELFDVYRGEKIGKNNKNLAFRISYQAERTLTGPEVDEIQAALVKRMEERFEAKIRDY